MSPVPGRTVAWPDPVQPASYSRLTVGEIDTTRLLVDMYERVQAQSCLSLPTSLFVLAIGFALGLLAFASLHDLVLHVNGCFADSRSPRTATSCCCPDQDPDPKALALASIPAPVNFYAQAHFFSDSKATARETTPRLLVDPGLPAVNPPNEKAANELVVPATERVCCGM